MIPIKEAIIVEGRYDVNKIKQIFDTIVLETNGFGIFSDKNKVTMLRNLAQKRGLIVLTDSDGAGIVIRNYIRKVVPNEYVKHAYVPEVHGKEKRKRVPGKENLIGVEGIADDVIIHAVRNAGATILDQDARECEFLKGQQITKTTLFSVGLSGCAGSSELRSELLKKLGLPSRLSANALMDYCNCMYNEVEFIELVKELHSD